MNGPHDVTALVGGRYRVLHPLGAGGMGYVFAVEHAITRRRHALKRVRPEAAHHPEVLARFEREALFAGAFTHENILAATDAGVDAEGPYLVFDLLEGETVGQRLKRVGAFPLRDALAITHTLLDALAHVHERGVIHRDIKPGNLFLAQMGGREVVRLIDFGIAKRVHDAGPLPESLEFTTGLNSPATPQYACPEQLASDPNIDATADLWSAAATFFKMATGEAPFPGTSAQIMEAMYRRGPPSLTARVPGAPAALDAWLARAFSVDRAGRFRTAGEMRAALHAACAAPPPHTAPVRPAADDHGTLNPVITAPAPSPSKRPLVIASALAVLIVCAAGAARLAMRADEPPAPSIATSASAPAPTPAPAITPAPRLAAPAPAPRITAAPPAPAAPTAVATPTVADAGAPPPSRSARRTRPAAHDRGAPGADPWTVDRAPSVPVAPVAPTTPAAPVEDLRSANN